MLIYKKLTLLYSKIIRLNLSIFSYSTYMASLFPSFLPSSFFLFVLPSFLPALLFFPLCSSLFFLFTIYICQGLSQGSPGQDLDLRLQEKKTLVKEPRRTSGGEPSRSWEGHWKSLRGTPVLSEYITLMVNRGRGTLLLTMENQACLNELWPFKP